MKKFIVLISICFVYTTNYSQQLYINEIMPSNDTTVADFNGNFSDWIELFNSSASAINLQGYFLTDNENDSTKWVFPNIMIDANSFLIIWASLNDTVYPNGEIHTNFKLSSSGEVLSLYSPLDTSLIDQFDSISIANNYSYGRFPDGANDLYHFSVSSFNNGSVIGS